jgi:hypothetical protein
VNVARKERWPEVSVGFENRTYAATTICGPPSLCSASAFRSGNSSKYRAAVRREEEKRKAAEFETKDYEQSVREEVHGLVVKISAMRREALLYRDQIIPRSEQALASARAMFESGGMLRDVLDARRMLLEGKLMYVRAVAEQYEMLSELVLCCGLGDLEALQMIGANSDSKTETTNLERLKPMKFIARHLNLIGLLLLAAFSARQPGCTSKHRNMRQRQRPKSHSPPRSTPVRCIPKSPALRQLIVPNVE